jgi:nucleoside-diphosphate-sugar epimerase
MTVLVTGASGFLGGRVAALLAASGRRVRLLWRARIGRRPPAGLEIAHGDLADAASLVAACRGAASVIHCAGQAGVWGPLSSYIETNAMGTARLLAAARRQGVKRLVYTSTPSVVHCGASLSGIDESAPYSLDSSQPYAYSKMLAERLVLSADSSELRTAALRPHLIWGPGDPHLLPRLADRARRGRLALFSGGPWMVDATYIDNAAEAHLLALDKLESGQGIGGEAFFIAQGEPVDLNILINRLLAAVGAPPARRRISRGLGLAAASLAEGLWRVLKLSGEPPITVFAARQMSSSHWYDLSKARRLLGYGPRISTAEGLALLAAGALEGAKNES